VKSHLFGVDRGKFWWAIAVDFPFAIFRLSFVIAEQSASGDDK
jgi:hypothetical protein